MIGKHFQSLLVVIAPMTTLPSRALAVSGLIVGTVCENHYLHHSPHLVRRQLCVENYEDGEDLNPHNIPTIKMKEQSNNKLCCHGALSIFHIFKSYQENHTQFSAL